MDDTRRRHLLAIANLEKYAVETFNDIYYSLITSKRDNGKIKTDCIYGSGVVENQIIQNGNFSDGTTGWGGNSGTQNFSTLSVSGGVLTQTFTSTPDAGYKSGIIVTPTQYRFDTYKDHYYFVFFKCKSNANRTWRCYTESTSYFDNTSGTANSWTVFKAIKKATTNKVNDYLMPCIDDATTLVNGDTLQFSDVNFIDLTLMYGTGNEPTSLSDHRIQALLNRGYIPYNAGTYKPSIIEELVMEPYNLFDGELEGNGINTTTGAKENAVNCFRSVNYLNVCGGRTYQFEFVATSLGSAYSIFIEKYDENHNYLGWESKYQNNNFSITFDNGVKYIMFHFYKSGSGWASNVPTDTNIVIHETNYNLFDGKIATDNKYVGSNGSLIDSTNFAVSNYFGIAGGSSCVVKNVSGSNPAICFYDKNKNYISGTAYDGQTTVTVTAPNKACFARISIYKANINTITLWCNRTGYAPYKGIPMSLNGARSILGKQNDLTDVTIGTDNDNYYMLADKTYCLNSNTNQLVLYNVNIKSGHKYYVFIAFSGTVSQVGSNFYINGNSVGTVTSYFNTSRNTFEYIYTADSDVTLTRFHLYTWVSNNPYANFGVPTKTFWIDLTALGIDTLTANQVYDLLKSNNLLDALANGEIIAGGILSKIRLLSAIQLDGALNAKNKLQITPQNYVITRNVINTAMNALSWTARGEIVTGLYTFSATLSDSKVYPLDTPVSSINMINTIGELVPVTGVGQANSINKLFVLCSGSSTTLYICNTSNTNPITNKDSVTYELATPQTTTIARRHLKAVDLSTLDFAYNSTDKAFYVQLTDMVNSTYYSKIFTPNYLGEIITTLSGMGDRHIAISNRWLYIRDLRYNTVNAFKAAVAGQYLWYETTNEVDDMVNKALFENGGCIRACEFGWVENQQFIIPTISSTTTNGITITNNGDGTVTISGTASAQTTFTLMGNLSRPIPLGHKVLITNFDNPNVSTYYMQDAYESNVTADLVNTPKGFIKTKQGSDTILSPRIYIANGTAITTPQTVKVEYFDLTLAFGAGNEPTSINDWRIQYILNKGYIPTNTTGTLKHIDTEVLPSADMKVQQ